MKGKNKGTVTKKLLGERVENKPKNGKEITKALLMADNRRKPKSIKSKGRYGMRDKKRLDK